MLADQYDALRSKRAYKPPHDHATTYEIITKGDGRTRPEHFDPLVLKAFRETASLFEEVFEWNPEENIRTGASPNEAKGRIPVHIWNSAALE